MDVQPAAHDLSNCSPRTGLAARLAIRAGQRDAPTAGVAPGYVQANLCILPAADAQDFLLFCQRNPKPCPLLASSEPGDPRLPTLGADLDIRTDVPRYRIWRDGALVEEVDTVTEHWRDDLVAFLLGCSFSFEEALLAAGVPMRHMEHRCNVPMYRTNIATTPAGRFGGPMVVSMRPMLPAHAIRAVQVTSRFPSVHGAPVHLGDPAAIGIADLGRPDYGDAVEIRAGEMPVFWACGVTPQSVVAASRPAFCITHAPGYMLVTDLVNAQLAVFLKGGQPGGSDPVTPRPPSRLLETMLTRRPTAAEAQAIGRGETAALVATAGALRDQGHGDLVTYSRKVFIPLTMLCRDVCHYCTFAKPPRADTPAYLPIEAVLQIARDGAAQGCKEALFTLGDKPERRYAAARSELAALGYGSTVDYLTAAARAVLNETGLLPHVNRACWIGARWRRCARCRFPGYDAGERGDAPYGAGRPALRIPRQGAGCPPGDAPAGGGIRRTLHDRPADRHRRDARRTARHHAGDP